MLVFLLVKCLLSQHLIYTTNTLLLTLLHKITIYYHTINHSSLDLISCLFIKPKNKNVNYGQNPKGWFNSIAGVVRRQFASYIRLNLAKNENEGEENSLPPSNISRQNNEKKYNFLRYDNSNNVFRTTINSTSTTTTTNTTSTDTQSQLQQHGASHLNVSENKTRQYPLPLQPLSSASASISTSSSSASGGPSTVATAACATQNGQEHQLKGIDRRHRSPDPPPRLNRGQSPMLLRKNLYELQQNSPKLQQRR